MSLRILFFGRLRDVAGDGERLVDPPADVRDCGTLADWLSREDPELRAALGAKDVKIAVDAAFADRNAPIAAAREIAFMPPFSGG